jgi:hypothetical protein
VHVGAKTPSANPDERVKAGCAGAVATAIAIGWTWPLGAWLAASIVGLWITSALDREFWSPVRDVFIATTIGLGADMVLLLAFRFALRPSVEAITRGERVAVHAQETVVRYTTLSWGVTVALLAVVMIVASHFPHLPLVTRYLAVRRLLRIVPLALTAATAFTFFKVAVAPEASDLAASSLNMTLRDARAREVKALEQQLVASAVQKFVGTLTPQERLEFRNAVVNVNDVSGRSARLRRRTLRDLLGEAPPKPTQDSNVREEMLAYSEPLVPRRDIVHATESSLSAAREAERLADELDRGARKMVEETLDLPQKTAFDTAWEITTRLVGDQPFLGMVKPLAERALTAVPHKLKEDMVRSVVATMHRKFWPERSTPPDRRVREVAADSLRRDVELAARAVVFAENRAAELTAAVHRHDEGAAAEAETLLQKAIRFVIAIRTELEESAVIDAGGHMSATAESLLGTTANDQVRNLLANVTAVQALADRPEVKDAERVVVAAEQKKVEAQREAERLKMEEGRHDVEIP